MLVHCKTPGGVLYLPDGTRIYGAATGRKPTDIPYEVYRTHKDGLVDATYRSYDLERIFGRPFTPIAFKIEEVLHLPYNTLRKLASEIGVLNAERAEKTRMARSVQRALRWGMANCENCGKQFTKGMSSQKVCGRRCSRQLWG